MVTWASEREQLEERVQIARVLQDVDRVRRVSVLRALAGPGGLRVDGPLPPREA